MFRIIHLSDLHLTTKDTDARTEPRFYGQLTGMNSAFRRIVASQTVQTADRILITGDVTDRGELGAWGYFWNTIKEAQLFDKVIVLPGNHDVCCLGNRIPKPENAAADLEKAIKGLRLGNQPTHFPWVVEIPDPGVAIFGLNSCNLGNKNVFTNARGWLGHHQLVALASLLHKHRMVPIKIVALHHSPNIPEVETAKYRGQIPMKSIERLANQLPVNQRQALRLVCIASGVRMIIHGHLHYHENRRVNGLPIVGAPSSTEPIALSESSPRYAFWEYTISGEKPKISRHLCTLPL